MKSVTGRELAKALEKKGWSLLRIQGSVLASAVFGITTTDPRTYAAIPTFLLLVALAASYLPARRATRVDPIAALRAE